MTAQHILKLIETVDPNDTEALDEIDARVWCYLEGCGFFSVNKKYVFGEKHCEKCPPVRHTHPFKKLLRKEPLKQYTRSRDALKSVRPEGWGLNMGNKSKIGGTLYWCELDHPTFDAVDSGRQKTEELAELHAIIRAIQHEREGA